MTQSIYYLDNITFVMRIKKPKHDIIEVYGLEPSWEINTSGKTGEEILFVRLRSKKVYYDLLRYAEYPSYEWYLKDPILNANHFHQRSR